MSDSQALKDFFAAWGENDATPPGGVDPLGGGERLHATADPNTPEPIGSRSTKSCGYVAQFSANMPGASATVIDPVDQHHGHARVSVRWDFGGGKQMVGQYFADIDGDGKIAGLVGFVGKGAE